MPAETLGTLAPALDADAEELTSAEWQEIKEAKQKPAPKQSAAAREKADILDSLDPAHLSIKNVDWVVFGWMVMIHAGALAAPFFFSWSALAVCVLLHWVTCSIGICLGYHRYLAHKSLKLKQPAEFLTLLCGAISGEGLL